jgi:hypothetical protein
MTTYVFKSQEWPFQPSTCLRFFYRISVLRKQYNEGEKVTFSPDTIFSMVVPDSGEVSPYLMATCPLSGCTMHLPVRLTEDRELENHNDAIAYMHRTLCRDAIRVTQRDIADLARYPQRKHYTAEFYESVIQDLQYKIDTFASFNYYPQFN